MHKTVILEINGKNVNIDEKIAPLIDYINKNYTYTQCSCEGDVKDSGELAYIAFNIGHFTIFIDKLRKQGCDKFLSRVMSRRLDVVPTICSCECKNVIYTIIFRFKQSEIQKILDEIMI